MERALVCSEHCASLILSTEWLWKGRVPCFLFKHTWSWLLFTFVCLFMWANKPNSSGVGLSCIVIYPKLALWGKEAIDDFGSSLQSFVAEGRWVRTVRQHLGYWMLQGLRGLNTVSLEDIKASCLANLLYHRYLWLLWPVTYPCFPKQKPQTKKIPLRAPKLQISVRGK